MEKALAQLRSEVEGSAVQNEKLKIDKDDRLQRDLNSKVFVDKKGNEKLRD